MRTTASALRWILCLWLAAELYAAEPSFIRIDQFGYLPGARKLAVIADPQNGFDAQLQYAPGERLQVRRERDLGVVFEDRPRAWRAGATHADSGDRCWLLDFSSVSTEGRYHVYDPATGHRSAPFSVGRTVYRSAAIQAARMFFYQRSGFAKQPPFTNARWADEAAHTRANQDSRARSVTDRANPATERDLRGGWFDAGDYNKYVTFAWDAMQSLLLAYEENPKVWGDDHAIPESGNGIPDLLDEVRWELDWFLRMQEPDGSLLNRVHDAPGSRSVSPASADANERSYGAAGTRSTVAGADVLAHGAIVFESLGRADARAYAAVLRAAAIKAWQWARANPDAVYTDHFGKGGDNPHSATTYAVWMCRAAAKLFRLTGESNYREYFDANYRKANLFPWNFAYVFEAPLQDALLYYARTPGATPAVAADIRNIYGRAVRTGSDNLPRFINEDDPYQAFSAAGDYTWGSNRWKAEKGGMFAVMASDRIDPDNTATYRHAAAAYLHYLHGVNPLAIVYLSNMDAYGATRSVTEFYHHWFANGTAWDSSVTSAKGPPPGFLSGGANPRYRPDASYTGPRLAPPLDQPAMKAYRDWNTSWPQNSWEVTEPAIYYQAAYLRLLAGFLDERVPGNSALVGLAARALVGEGDKAAFPGFSIAGSGNGRILVRVVGPGLTQFGVTGTAADPKLALFDHSTSPPSRRLINDSWEQGDATAVRAAAALTGAFPLSSGSRDAATVADLAPGSYSVMAENGAGVGVGLVEVFDAGDSRDRERRRFTGLSCRAQVGSGSGILIPGIVVGGTETITLVVRALGPALRRLGVSDPLPDPQLTLFADAVPIAANDNWDDQSDSPRVWQAMRRAGLADLDPGSRDAALLVTVPPGNYTVHVSGKQVGSEGTAVVEIYEARP